jgi:predicted hydrocarbon binding protein
MVSFEELKGNLDLTQDHRLMLSTVPMVLMPRWFFTDIMNRVRELAGPEIAREVYYRAGWDGAVKWARVQMEEAGLSGRAVMEQYLGSAGDRGWGRFEIMELDQETGQGLFHLHGSAVARENGPSETPVCDHLPGSLAGAMQAILDHQDRGIKVAGREVGCLAQGEEYCRFVVEPVKD